MKNIIMITTLILFCAASCKKEKIAEIDKLPQATQTGANTFGCLVNGKAWVAQRNDCSIVCSPSFKVYYDGSNGGYVGITALKIDIENNSDEQFNIVFDSSNFKRIHSITIFNALTTASFRNYAVSNACNAYLHSLDSTAIYLGKVTITKYDLQNGIISGTFDFTLTKPGCETITVTEGRFDKKL